MQFTMQKMLRWAAVPAILGGLYHLILIFKTWFPSSPDYHNLYNQIRVLVYYGLIYMWLTGAYFWHRKDIGKTGLVGFIIMICGELLATAWYFSSGWKGFEWWNSLSLILSCWGVLLFGTAMIKVGRFPGLVIVLWMTGRLMGCSGLSAQWTGRHFMMLLGMIGCGIYFWIKSKPKDALSPIIKTSKNARYHSLDLLRGLIMIIMAIDHASLFIRRTHPFEIWNTSVPDYFADGAVFLTRFVTHLCAPGFFLLMGVGMILLANSRRDKGWSYGQIMRHLAFRGILLICLEKLILNPLLFGGLAFIKFGVLYALGGSMLLGVLFLKINRFGLFIVGVTGILCTQVLPQTVASLGWYNQPIMYLLAIPQLLATWSNLYPVLPWLSITLLGMALGKELLRDSKKAYDKVLIFGLICLVLFPVIRWIGGFGNFQPIAGNGWINFLNVVKYPPSLVFTLMTLGANCMLLVLFERFQGWLGQLKSPLLVFGKTALFFYLSHWFLYSTIGSIFYLLKANLWYLYLGWTAGLLMLYPICRLYLEFKNQTATNSVWRFI